MVRFNISLCPGGFALRLRVGHLSRHGHGALRGAGGCNSVSIVRHTVAEVFHFLVVLLVRLLHVGQGDQQRGGQEQRGNNAFHDTDELDHRQVLQRTHAEQPHGHDHQRDDRQSGNDGRRNGTHQGLVDGQVRFLRVGGTTGIQHALGVLLHLVKHDHRVVEGEGQHRQKTNDHRRGDFEAEEGVDAHDHHSVEKQCDHRGDSHIALQTNSNVHSSGDEEDHHGQNHALRDRGTPRFRHRRITDGIRRGLAVSVLRLVGLVDCLARRVDLLLSEQLGVDLQRARITRTDDLRQLWGHTGGLDEGVLDFLRHQVAGRHAHLRAALKVNAQVESAQSHRCERNHQQHNSDGVPELGAANEVNRALALVEALNARCTALLEVNVLRSRVCHNRSRLRGVNGVTHS